MMSALLKTSTAFVSGFKAPTTMAFATAFVGTLNQCPKSATLLNPWASFSKGRDSWRSHSRRAGRKMDTLSKPSLITSSSARPLVFG